MDFPDTKNVRVGDMFVSTPLMTDENKIAVIDQLFGVNRKAEKADGFYAMAMGAAEVKRPHLNTFLGRLVDQNGNIIDDKYPVVSWIHTFSAAGLKGVAAKSAREVIKEWGLEHKWNDLIERLKVRIEKWDGNSRMESKLIELFQCADTPLNRRFGKYFWLSLYARMMHPGSYAPMVLSLFGGQNSGKSQFSKLLCRTILENQEAKPAPLDLAAEWTPFLRAITGQSIVAEVGEMVGFTRGDLNRVKDFITFESDNFHYKFEGNFDQQRQWITVMTGNKYEGLQRDETGNRRFYPMFCGQQENDDAGKPQWDDNFEAIFDDVEKGICFEEDVWQLLAEAQEWYAENGKEGYVNYVREVVRQVREFNASEMAKGSGGISDPVVSLFLPKAIAAVKAAWRPEGVACSIPGTKKTAFLPVPQGIVIYVDDFVQAMERVAGKQSIKSERTKAELMAYGEQNGAIVGKFSGKRPGILFCVGKDNCWEGNRPSPARDSLLVDGEGGKQYSSDSADEAVNKLKKKLAGKDWEDIAKVNIGY